ncbi:DNA-binding response regulator, NarL/FixJ family, contains REC and HTH domains [Actinokineospora alba]|uniref:DNA-binding response regulator, NarL/FixJ family, contains REC and HTH domains n=1 Tax=Actinokineospora alba TaxID=504798 RepID=A0A1H0QVU7_9PSEU|nr:response regulator transcription factor [Actinokineospora alba]TDP70371.1 LuxR family two component transcriptional regulator [Actinokineospora alba]SDI33108.1 DNA-binding response regulator, NarL/FixJ family, contains REC and HTH domains [Actinokineospora alba]SDP21393.1 DNA-binding response regulator, NarL/FixJ family, contains REC and HTH domains [Actinokineospora alba]
MIRIVLVDDHPVVRAGLRALIDGQDDLSVVGEADGLDAALGAVASQRPDVVLMDLSLGAAAAGGAEITARLRGLPEPPEVLVLTTYDTESDILRALDAGARGYLLKDAPPPELFAGIRATARGETVLAPSVAATLVRRTARPGPTITEREVEVLELLSRGLGNKEMARELFVSEATVKSHLSHIYTKLGVDTRAGAVAAAIDRRIIRAT